VRGIAADGFPADKVTIPASLRVYKKSEDGVEANGLQEVRGARGKAEAGSAFLRIGFSEELRQDFLLLLWTGGGKAANTGESIGRQFLEVREALAVAGQIFTGKSFQGAIDEEDDAGFARAGCIGGGDDAGGDSVELAGLIGSEDVKSCWLLGLRGFVGVLRGGDDGRPLCSEPNCACGASEELKKFAACEIERVHGPSVVQSIYELRVAASTRNPGALLLIWPV